MSRRSIETNWFFWYGFLIGILSKKFFSFLRKIFRKNFQNCFQLVHSNLIGARRLPEQFSSVLSYIRTLGENNWKFEKSVSGIAVKYAFLQSRRSFREKMRKKNLNFFGRLNGKLFGFLMESFQQSRQYSICLSKGGNFFGYVFFSKKTFWFCSIIRLRVKLLPFLWWKVFRNACQNCWLGVQRKIKREFFLQFFLFVWYFEKKSENVLDFTKKDGWPVVCKKAIDAKSRGRNLQQKNEKKSSSSFLSSPYKKKPSQRGYRIGFLLYSSIWKIRWLLNYSSTYISNE